MISRSRNYDYYYRRLIYILCSWLIMFGVTRSDAQENYEEIVYSIDWHPSTNQLVVGYGHVFWDQFQSSPTGCSGDTEGPTVYTFDVQGGTRVGLPQSNFCFVNVVDWNPDATRIVAAIDSYAWGVWNVETLEREQYLFTFDKVLDLEWSENDTSILATSMSGIGEVDAETLEYRDYPRILTSQLASGISPAHFTASAWSYQENYIAGALDNNEVWVWLEKTSDINQTVVRFTEHTDIVRSIQWSPMDTVVVSSDRAGVIHVWDGLTGNLIWNVIQSDELRQVGWSPDGQFIAALSSNLISVYDAKNGDFLSSFVLQGHPLGFAWGPNSDEIAYGGINSDGQHLGPHFIPLP